MTGRDRQVAAYRRSRSYAVKELTRSKANASAVEWVRHFHPQIWEQLHAQAVNAALNELRGRRFPGDPDGTVEP